jgi:hypothetical protein
MNETKCLKVNSKTKIILATNDLSARCLSLENFFPGTFEFFPEVPGCSQVSLLKLPVSGGSGLSKIAVVVPNLRVFIPPCLPMVIPSSLRQIVAFAPHLYQALTPTNFNPNPTQAFKCGVIPCENKQIQAPSCVLEHLLDP